jgi:hypothetical protein
VAAQGSCNTNPPSTAIPATLSVKRDSDFSSSRRGVGDPHGTVPPRAGPGPDDRRPGQLLQIAPPSPTSTIISCGWLTTPASARGVARVASGPLATTARRAGWLVSQAPLQTRSTRLPVRSPSPRPACVGSGTAAHRLRSSPKGYDSQQIPDGTLGCRIRGHGAAGLCGHNRRPGCDRRNWDEPGAGTCRTYCGEILEGLAVVRRKAEEKVSGTRRKGVRNPDTFSSPAGQFREILSIARAHNYPG